MMGELLSQALVASVSSSPSAPKHPSVFEETYIYLIALAVMIVALVTISVLRSRKQGKAYLDLLRSSLKETDVLLRAADAERLRTCWHCAAPEAVHRPVRLSRVVFLGVGVGGEWVTPSIPLCPGHGSPNLGPHWARTLGLPLGGLAFAIAVAIWPFHGRVLGCVWIGISVAIGVSVAWSLLRWANRNETFRLVFLDTHDSTMIVRFKDAARAATVREEVGDISEPPAPDAVAGAASEDKLSP